MQNILGYTHIHKVDDINYIGCILVTDKLGIPIEFKYSELIKPTKIQQILYGKTLDLFIKKDILLNGLYRNIEKKPNIIITGSFIIKTMDIGFNLIHLSKTNSPFMEKVGDRSKINETEYLIQTTNYESPLRVSFLSNLSESLKEEIINTLISLSSEMDIYEPIERIEQVIKILCSGLEN